MRLPLAVIHIGIDPVLIHLGPLSIHWYGIMYVAGLSLALRVVIPFGETHGISKETIYSIFWSLLIGGLIGGRLYYVVQSNLGWYLSHPQNIVATWEGGMAFYGAVFVDIVVVVVVCRRRRLSIPVFLDGAAIFAVVAQAVGRIGNLINGDIVGYPSSLPWATQYTNLHNTFVASHAVAYDPAAAYELLFNVLLFVILWRLRYRFRVPGTLFALWLTSYSVGQFVLFFDRANVVVAAGLKQAQLTAILVVLVTVPAWLYWRRHYRPVNLQAESPRAASSA